MAKVLLVEDDNNLREIYEARLSAEGYDISTAQDGEEALVVAKQVKPDLVISDVMMPKISGFEMLDILRNTPGLEHVQVIMLTALGQSEDQDRADSLGADKYLVKSQVTLEDIVKTTHELLNDQVAEPAPVEDTPTPPAESTPTPVEATPAETAASEDPATVETEPLAAEPEAVVATPEESPAPAETDSAVSPEGNDATATDENVSDSSAETAEKASVNSVITPTTEAESTVAEDAQIATDTPPVTTPTDNPVVDTNDASQPQDQVVEAEISDEPTQSETADETATPNTETPTPEVTAPAEDELTAAATTAADDQIIANAVTELASGNEDTTPEQQIVEPSSEATEPTGTPEGADSVPQQIITPTPIDDETTEKITERANNISISGKRTIQPLDSVPKPDINELAAREEAAAITSQPIVATSQSAPGVPTEAPAIASQPGQSFTPQPQSEAPVTAAVEDDQPSGTPVTPPPSKDDAFDPNSVAL